MSYKQGDGQLTFGLRKQAERAVGLRANQNTRWPSPSRELTSLRAMEECLMREKVQMLLNVCRRAACCWLACQCVSCRSPMSQPA